MIGGYPSCNSNPYMQYNPYMERYNNQYQQMQPQVNNIPRNNLVGKMVDNFNCITANDVPMDGSCAIFPKNDLSEIQLRQWNSNGVINTVVYKPILDTKEVEATNTPQIDFKSEFGRITALCEDINKRLDMIGSVNDGNYPKSDADVTKSDD